MSSQKLSVIRLTPPRQPETPLEKREALLREYQRIVATVWPDYTDIIGEHGIAAIAAEAHVAPISPNFPIYAARATAAQLVGRIAVWNKRPPEEHERAVIRVFCELNPTELYDTDEFELILGRIMLRDLTFRPLEAEIPPSDPTLIAMWHRSPDPETGSSRIIDPRSWLWEHEPEAPQPPTPKPRVLH